MVAAYGDGREICRAFPPAEVRRRGVIDVHFRRVPHFVLRGRASVHERSSDRPWVGITVGCRTAICASELLAKIGFFLPRRYRVFPELRLAINALRMVASSQSPTISPLALIAQAIVFTAPGQSSVVNAEPS